MAVLDGEEIPWEMAIESGSDRAIEATISADLAIGAMLEGTEPPQLELISHGGGLPALPEQQINLYAAKEHAAPGVAELADMLRQSYAGLTSGNVVKFG